MMQYPNLPFFQSGAFGSGSNSSELTTATRTSLDSFLCGWMEMSRSVFAIKMNLFKKLFVGPTFFSPARVTNREEGETHVRLDRRSDCAGLTVSETL